MKGRATYDAEVPTSVDAERPGLPQRQVAVYRERPAGERTAMLDVTNGIHLDLRSVLYRSIRTGYTCAHIRTHTKTGRGLDSVASKRPAAMPPRNNVVYDNNRSRVGKSASAQAGGKSGGVIKTTGMMKTTAEGMDIFRSICSDKGVMHCTVVSGGLERYSVGFAGDCVQVMK